MDWWLIALLGGGVALLALRLWAGPAPKAPPSPVIEQDGGAQEPLWTPAALARLGTQETIADLVAQGRADELRGLGYRGDLPES